MKVAAEAARRFLVERHLLAPARSLAGLDGVLESSGYVLPILFGDRFVGPDRSTSAAEA